MVPSMRAPSHYSMRPTVRPAPGKLGAVAVLEMVDVEAFRVGIGFEMV